MALFFNEPKLIHSDRWRSRPPWITKNHVALSKDVSLLFDNAVITPKLFVLLRNLMIFGRHQIRVAVR